MTSAAEAIAAWALGLTLDDIPESTRRATCRHLLDGVGVAVLGHRAQAVPFAIDVAASLGGPEEATVLGDGRRMSAPAAALANGALVHGLDFDDTHPGGIVHATASVMPAAFAVGEQVGASGSEVLSAAVVGYEVVCRLGAAVPHGFHAVGFHATSVCGVFAAAIVAARLTRCSVPQAVDALGIAGSMAAGSLEFLHTGAATKQLHPGLSALNGILAARLAAAGASGPASIFEGEYGLFQAYTGQEVQGATLTNGLGERWEVEHVAIKPYPACHLSHASLDALRSVAHTVPVEEVESVVFDIPSESVAIIGSESDPRTGYEAKFSLAWCAAALLLDGVLDVSSFDDVSRPAVNSLARRIVLRPVLLDVPAVDAPGRVELKLLGGRTIVGAVPRSRGGPDRPLTDDELMAKVGNKDLAAEVLSLDRQASLEPIIAATCR